MYFLTSNCDRHCHAKFQSLSFFLGRLWIAVTQTLILIQESKSASSFVSQQTKTRQLSFAAFCPQNAIPGRVSSYPLSVAMASRVDCSAFHLRHVLFFSHQYVTIRDWIVGAIHSGFRLLAVCLFSYNPSFSYLSLCDCKATTLCYNNGLGRDDKRRTVDSSVVNKTLRQPRNRVTGQFFNC